MSLQCVSITSPFACRVDSQMLHQTAIDFFNLRFPDSVIYSHSWEKIGGQLIDGQFVLTGPFSFVLRPLSK